MPHDLVIDIEGNVFAMDYDDPNDAGGERFPIDGLIREAVSDDMMEDEPDAIALLRKFRARLQASLSFVDEAIAKLEPNKSG